MAIRIYGKRLIQTPPGLATRPTSARVREAIFNIWHDRIPGSSWLDLCAGSGSMGAEALARGAAQVVGIERDGAACRIIQENWQRVAAQPQKFTVLRGDVRSRLKTLQLKFDLIYFDPPYQAHLYESVLSRIIDLDLLAANGAIAAEHDRDQPLAATISQLTAVKQSNYGQTSVTFYQKHSDLA